MTTLQEKPLSPRHLKFIDLMAKGGLSKSQAYVQAGFSKKGANAGAIHLLSRPGVQSAIEVRRSAFLARIDSRQASALVKAEANAIADMIELESGLTLEWRGAEYRKDIEAMQARLDRKISKVEALEVAVEDPALDPKAKAFLMARLLDAEDRIMDDLATIANIRISGRAEANKAAVTLLKVKGAFEPKRAPVDDPQAILNDLARNIIRSRFRPSHLSERLDAMIGDAKDAAFSLRQGNPGTPESDSGGGTGSGDRAAGRPDLFRRPLASSEDSGS